MNRSQRGVALLIVLWVMTILMVTVFSFSLMTRAETYGTFTFKDRMEKRYLAEAGLERGIAEMINYSLNAAQTTTLEGKELWKMDGTAYSGRMANGGYVVRMYDESGKISLNGLTDASGIMVKNLLVNLGSPPEEADTIVDSILDWKDEDDLHRLSGAENDYYQSLPHPYKARNADFDSLEELLLVKGVTPDILYGTDTRKGLIQFLTLYNATNQINLAVAPKEVVDALPGVDAAQADQVMELRKSAATMNDAELTSLIGGANSFAAPYVSAQAGGATVCTIAATGYKDVEKKGYSITATVELQGSPKYRYLSYRSPSEGI
jgi:general secretion pathway protein K